MLRSKFFLNITVHFIVFVLLTSCGAVKPYYSKKSRNWSEAPQPPADELLHSVFLIGDVGEPEQDRQEPSLKLLRMQLRNGMEPEGKDVQRWAKLPDSMKTVIFLGDNIYHDGLSEPEDPEREEEERRIKEQMKVVKNWEGRPVFIPGNHDWDFSSEGGLEAVIRQEQYVEEYLESRNVFLPDLGCPGPYPVPLGDELVVILLDSEWWLTRYKRPEGSENGCGVESELDLIVQLDDMLDRFQDRHVVLALHHPLVSNGNHGGYFSILDHIFPLTLLYPDAYIPLPILGSVYPLARKYGLSRQDLTNPKYRKLSRAISSVLEGRNNVTVAAGHDHSLQLHEKGDLKQVLSGAGCKETYCVGGRGATFVHRHEGFARLNYYKNGEVWVEYWEPLEDGSQGRLIFKKALYALSDPEGEPLKKEEIPDYTDSTKVIAASPDYAQVGSTGRAIWGDHYRKEWKTPIEVPYLDLERKMGGLRIVKKGGGMQTLSLHLMDKDSITYYFRSVNKDPSEVLPEALQETFAEDFLQDQVSSAHPYGALALPKMADAAQVYHANPEVLYMPYTPSLGPYLNEFGGMLGTFEMKADEDVTDYDNFGNAENAVGTDKLFEELREDNDEEVNQASFLRARLFDMLIGDWDRHEGQWRWAEFDKPDKGNTYEPVPKDRDQVFVKYDGLVPWLFSRKWLFRKFRNFDYGFNDVVGLNYNARYIDRRFLNNLSWEEWEEQIAFLQENLTDSILEQSVRDLPPEIFKISGPEIIAKLKSRREELPVAARQYFEVLAEYVNVVGSDKHELFMVNRLADGRTRVEVFKTEKDGDREQNLYGRTFEPGLTKEIRLYGLGGIDQFRISGKASSAIKLRIVGGEEEDVLEDKSNISRLRRNVIYYDDKEEENEIKAGPETRLKLSGKDYVNEYDYREFSYPYMGTGPRLTAEYNRDDGLFLGGGINVKSYGFRKKPFASDQTLLGSYALKTEALTLTYRGRFYSFFSRKLDLMVNADFFGPKYVMNYYGQGNGTSKNLPTSFYRIGQNKVQVYPFVNWNLHEYIKVGAGPEFRYVDVGTERNYRTIINSDEFRQSDLFQEFTYMGGARLFANLKAVNQEISPTRGIHWQNELSYLRSFNHRKVNLTRLKSDLVLYISPDVKFSPTLALRFGGQRNFGDFLFFQSASLGQTENLRGFRRTRFSGYASAYQNTELRIPLGRMANYVFTGTWGVYGFMDHGRVWSRYQDPDTWHRACGPGVFLSLYNLFVASASVGFSEEGTYFLVNTGFFFK